MTILLLAWLGCSVLATAVLAAVSRGGRLVEAQRRSHLEALGQHQHEAQLMAQQSGVGGQIPSPRLAADREDALHLR